MNNTIFDLPTVALSIRQPYPHFILNEGKDVENRSWATTFRGLALIHAAKGIDALDKPLVDRLALPRGGIVGVVEVVDCVTDSASDWFCGPYGFVLKNPQPLPFVPCLGRLGFFRVPDDIMERLCAGPATTGTPSSR